MAVKFRAARKFFYDRVASIDDVTAEIGGSTNPRIEQRIATNETVLPFVRIKRIPILGGGDKYTLNWSRYWTRFGVRVFAVGKVEMAGTLYTIADEIDEHLDSIKSTLTPEITVYDEGRVHSFHRDDEYEYDYEKDGIRYLEIGADWIVAVT